VTLRKGLNGEVRLVLDPDQELARFGDLLPCVSSRDVHVGEPDPFPQPAEVVPGGVLLDDRRDLGSVVEFNKSLGQPAFEDRQMPVGRRGDHAVVDEDGAEMFDRGGAGQLVESIMGELDLAFTDPNQEFSGSFASHPRVDALWSLSIREYMDEPHEAQVRGSGRLEKRLEVFGDDAAGACASAEAFCFGSASDASHFWAGDAGAVPADGGAVGASAGEESFVAAAWAATSGAVHAHGKDPTYSWNRHTTERRRSTVAGERFRANC
jgi:hypothetical protein